MLDAIVAAVIAVIAALGSLLAASEKKKKKLKDEADFEKKKAEILEKQMETINEVRKELKIIEEEEPPKVEGAPPRGDSDSRLDRLNRLHDN